LKLQIGIDGKAYEVEVEVLEDDEAPRHQHDATAYPLIPATVRSMPAPAAQTKPPLAEERGDEDKLCRSPVTGLVIKINVVPGQQIQANELIMVLEAMKMEANVTAPGAGKVKNVRVAPGDSVKVNQVVVEFE
jgi:methylmalonyl-CoA carboxyltransferase small subunit